MGTKKGIPYSFPFWCPWFPLKTALKGTNGKASYSLFQWFQWGYNPWGVNPSRGLSPSQKSSISIEKYGILLIVHHQHHQLLVLVGKGGSRPRPPPPASPAPASTSPKPSHPHPSVPFRPARPDFARYWPGSAPALSSNFIFSPRTA